MNVMVADDQALILEKWASEWEKNQYQRCYAARIIAANLRHLARVTDRAAVSPQVREHTTPTIHDAMRWSGCDPDYHGRVAFSPDQLKKFVSFFAAATVLPQVGEVECWNCGGRQVVSTGDWRGPELGYVTKPCPTCATPASLGEAKAVAPIEHPSVTLSGYQLLQALDFTWPDRGSSLDGTKQQGECEATIGYFEAAEYMDGDEKVDMPPGMYVFSTDYPDEGRCFLIDDADATHVAQTLPVAAEKDAELLRALIDEANPIDMIYFDDGKFLDVGGKFLGDLRVAIAVMQGEKA